MLLLWSSVPVLLLAGVSYPREAFPEWLFDIGRLLPSSSGVNGFIALASRGATLSEIREEVFTLVISTIIYITLTIFINKTRLNKANF
jgi:ABC-2 type transport system permease protein